MKLHILSDIHLEFAEFHPPRLEADVVVIAGDVAQGERGINWARAAFPKLDIVYVAGNHEFYRGNRLDTLARMRITARDCGVFFLDDEAVVIRGVRFLGATLWTDFALFGTTEIPYRMKAAMDFMADFRLVREGGRVFSPMDSIRLHEKSVAWLEVSLAQPFGGETVVVTHHLPSPMSVTDRWKDKPLSAAFASDLNHLMGVPTCWVHGHTHDSIDYKLNGTRVICNPRGYALFEYDPENMDFDPGLVIEV